ncbi:MAG: hypothetical protein H5T61_03180 [Thermoflexales bacterium]|nr:hypothetical protein [Thermoflexales bacterium]
MKRDKLGMGLAFLIVVATIAFIIRVNSQAGIAGELPPTPFILQTPSTWENASLEQIHFGSPRVVLTDTLGLRIVGWISNDEVLILRDTLPGRNRVAIEVFNAKTGALKRLKEGVIWGKPIWSSKEQSLAYLLYNESKKI